MHRALADLTACLRLYTRLPLPVHAREADPHALPEFSRAAWAVPVAGALVGLMGALALALADAFGIAPLPAATLAIGCLVLITGAMHEDGLADLCDGFGGGANPERKLEIMKDSRLGTYGVAALVLSLLLRIGTLAGLVAVDMRLAGAVLVASGAVSRATGLMPIALLPPARTFGAGFAATRPTPTRRSPTAMGIAALMSVPFACLPLLAGANLPRIIAALAAAALAAYGIAALARRQIGGQTGDVAGAAQQSAEIAMLLVFAAGQAIPT